MIDDTPQPPPSSGVVIDHDHQKPVLTATPEQIKQMFKVIEEDILPLTKEGVKDGNKVFGAAILKPATLQCHIATTNAETKCPIFHGEVHCIYQWSQATKPEERGSLAQSSIFLSTHEPCCMCISSILWAGFNQIYYFFPYSITTAQGYVPINHHDDAVLVVLLIVVCICVCAPRNIV